MMIKSRFFTTDDPKTDNFVYKLPNTWWSRFYEYEWVKNFVGANETVLDAASGVFHPLRFYLLDQGNIVYSCDTDKNILLKSFDDIDDRELENYSIKRNDLEHINNEHYFNSINSNCCSITNMPYKNNFFDKVFCISVLEHLDDKFNRKYKKYRHLWFFRKFIKQKALYDSMKEFKRVLKPGGFLILTFDYPDINLEYLARCIKSLGFEYLEKPDFNLPKNAIFSEEYKINCFRIVLKKKV